MKSTILTICLSVFICFVSYSQDSLFIMSRGNFIKYRKGYLVMSNNDTVRGLIALNRSSDTISFIKEGIHIKVKVFADFSEIPKICASEGKVKSFYRNRIFFETRKIPPDNNEVFLAVLEHGPLNLYILLCDLKDASVAKATAISALGLGVGLVGASILSIGNSSDNPEEEFYNVKAYYAQKKPSDTLIQIPSGERKFREAFYPMIKDNPTFLKELIGQSFDYNHLHDLVKQYNSSSKN
jgi:hypothetical protein